MVAETHPRHQTSEKSPKEPSNNQNSLRFSPQSHPEKPKLLVITEHDGAKNFLSGGLLGHSPAAFPVVTDQNSRALKHQLEDLREIALTGIPFDRGKPNLESQTSRAKRLRQLFQELDFNLKPDHNRSITQVPLNRVPKKTQPRDTLSQSIF